MFDTLTTDTGMRLGLAAGAVALGMVLLVIVLALLRRRNAALFVRGGKSRDPRLAVLDAAAVDTRRRLVLIRRDNVEHLIMIGGPTDIVIESGIGLAMPAAARAAEPATIEREPTFARPALPEPVAEPVFARPVAAPVKPEPVAEPAPAIRAVAEPAPAVVSPPVIKAEPVVAASAATLSNPAAAVLSQPERVVRPEAVAARPAAVVPAAAAGAAIQPAPVPPVSVVRPAEPAPLPVSAAGKALYSDPDEPSEEERRLAEILSRAQESRGQENRGQENRGTSAQPAASQIQAAAVAARPVPTAQANPVQPAGLAHGQISRRIEPVPPRKDETAEDILEAARNRVLATRPPDVAAEQRNQPQGRIEPGFGTLAESVARTAETAANRTFPQAGQPVVQAVAREPAMPSREDLASEFERILEAEMAANGIRLDDPVTAVPSAAPVVSVANDIRPAQNAGTSTLASDLELEMQRLLAERSIDRTGRS